MAVKQNEYITIYDMATPQDKFDTHGLGILTPTKCLISEEFNGAYQLSLEHPIDLEGKWKNIKEENIIKAKGQLFTIKLYDQSWNGSKGKVTAKASHIFYQLNDWWIPKNSPIQGATYMTLMRTASQSTVKHLGPDQTAYTFTFDSDYGDAATIDPNVSMYKWYDLDQGMTPNDFLLGTNGLIATFGGEMYRNNFYFSVNRRMENSSDNAFEIRIGKNLRGIKRTIDTSTICSYFKGYDNYGNTFAVSWAGTPMGTQYPHYTVREQNFSYSFPEGSVKDEAAAAMKCLQSDVNAYFNAYGKPLISYDIDLQDVKNNPDFEELTNRAVYKVGNKGKIYDERLGLESEFMITKTVTDAIRGEITNVVFGTQRGFSRQLR